ncbi:MAG: hypothetical protein Ta2G_04590 [Termitinemataceae bacterium]|nr:MAG: hypothetical protein Ta2G_04590 [Termitinemataceae bacterium]
MKTTKEWSKMLLSGMAAMVLAFGISVKNYAAPADNSYFVSASGKDTNDGKSQKSAFQTLGKAIEIATSGELKTITVIGTIVGSTEIKNAGSTEILITGLKNAKGKNMAVVTTTKEESLIFRVSSGKVRFENIVITGGVRGGLGLENGAEITLGENVKIEKNSAAVGAGAFIDGAKLFMLANSTISLNEADDGGGVWIQGGGSLIMQDTASIVSCKSGRSGGGGGGITLIAKSTLTLKDKATISNNEAKGAGGGFYSLDSTVLIQNEAIIKNNKAENNAGAFYAKNSTITISDNTSLTNNQAIRGGGAIFSNQSNITMTGNSSITGNKAVAFGGGVNMYNGGTFTMKGNSIIKDNSIGVTIGKVSSSDGTGNGGGVFLSSDCKFIMQEKSSITNNSAKSIGGGVYSQKGSTFTQGSGTVSGNKATEGDADISKE